MARGMGGIVTRTVLYKPAALVASPMAQTVRNLPAMLETWVQSLSPQDPLEEGMATHSSILAWKIRQRRLADYSTWDHKELDMT